MYSPLKMSGRPREENYLLWAIVIILIGKISSRPRPAPGKQSEIFVKVRAFWLQHTASSVGSSLISCRRRWGSWGSSWGSCGTRRTRWRWSSRERGRLAQWFLSVQNAMRNVRLGAKLICSAGPRSWITPTTPDCQTQTRSSLCTINGSPTTNPPRTACRATTRSAHPGLGTRGRTRTLVGRIYIKMIRPSDTVNTGEYYGAYFELSTWGLSDLDVVTPTCLWYF